MFDKALVGFLILYVMAGILGTVIGVLLVLEGVF